MIFEYVTRVFVGERLEWNLTIKPEQVIELVGGKNQGSFIERMFAPGISARGKGSKFSMSKMSIGNMPLSGNAFSHVLIGRIYPTPTGSKVVARFRLAIPYFIFATIWLTGACLGGFVGGIGGLVQMIKTQNFEQIGGVVFAMLFPIFGIIMLNVFRKMASSNEKEIKSTLVAAFSPYIK